MTPRNSTRKANRPANRSSRGFTHPVQRRDECRHGRLGLELPRAFGDGQEGEEEERHQLQAGEFTVDYTPSTDSVTLKLSSSKPFAKGGEIVISGVTSQAGVALSAADTTLTILPKAKGITMA